MDYSIFHRIYGKNYEVNKQSNLFVNDITYKSKRLKNNLGVDSKFIASLKNINYKQIMLITLKMKTHELSSAFGYFAKLNLFKVNTNNGSSQYFTPKNAI